MKSERLCCRQTDEGGRSIAIKSRIVRKISPCRLGLFFFMGRGMKDKKKGKKIRAFFVGGKKKIQKFKKFKENEI